MKTSISAILKVTFAAGLLPSLCSAQVDVLTWHNDNMRTGQNLNEKILTPANVNSSSFGKLFSLSVDGKVDAQPLIVSNLAINGGTHNVVLVATEHDSVYAFDADTGSPYWQVSMLKTGETTSDARNCGQVTPEIGVTATPVIDRTAGPHGTAYIVSMSKDGSGNYFQRLHALDLTTGAEQFGGPVNVQATYPGHGAGSNNGTVVFDPKQYKERPGLLLLNGIVYTSWGSHCDISPYTGWTMGYDRLTLAQKSVFNFAPNGSDAAIWQSGGGPAADPNGNLYFSVANGTFDTTLNSAQFPSQGDYGNAFVRLSVNGNTLTPVDYWTMDNTVAESNSDEDLGSGGVILLPDVVDGAGKTRHLGTGAGKDGNVYVFDRDNMGKFDAANNSTLYQEIANGLGGGEFATPAFFNGVVYYGAVGDVLRAFQVTSAKLSPASTTTNTFPRPGATPSISANGTTNAILWALDNSATAVLHAYDANNLKTELYNSNQAAGGRDNFGTGNKFVVPTIANGKVYAGTTNSVAVFGLLAPKAVSVSPNSGSGAFGTAQTFAYTFSDSSGYADISYTYTLLGGNSGGICLVLYSRAANQFYLMNDAQSAFLGPVTPGANATLSNSQCTLNAVSSSINPSGNNLVENLNLTFPAAFGGVKSNSGYVQNVAGQNSGLQTLGSWTVTGGTPILTATSVTPNSGTGLGPQVFTYTYSDSSGYADISYGYSMLSSSGGIANSCLVLFIRSSNAFYLLDNSGSQFQGPITGGSNTTLSNSQCTLNGAGSGISGTGNNLSVKTQLSFQAGFAGLKNNYAYVVNNGGQNSPLQNVGTWNP